MLRSEHLGYQMAEDTGSMSCFHPLQNNCYFLLIFSISLFVCSVLLFSANSEKNPSKARSVHQLLPAPSGEPSWEHCNVYGEKLL